MTADHSFCSGVSLTPLTHSRCDFLFQNLAATFLKMLFYASQNAINRIWLLIRPSCFLPRWTDNHSIFRLSCGKAFCGYHRAWICCLVEEAVVLCMLIRFRPIRFRSPLFSWNKYELRLCLVVVPSSYYYDFSILFFIQYPLSSSTITAAPIFQLFAFLIFGYHFPSFV
jgi:hypothetical protein